MQKRFFIETSSSFAPIILITELDKDFFNVLQERLGNHFDRNHFPIEQRKSNVILQNAEDLNEINKLVREKIERTNMIAESKIDLSEKSKFTTVFFPCAGEIHFKLAK